MERYRVTAFLMGAVISVSLLFVILEFSYKSSDENSHSDDTAGTLEEIDIMPVMSQQNMVALKEADKKSQNSNVVVARDDETEPLEEVSNDKPAGVDSEDGGKEDSVDENPETAVSPLASDMNDDPLNFHVVEDLPQFPGGAVEMMKWLTKNLKYPKEAQRRKKQGRVVVQFTVNTDGSVCDIKVIKSVDSQLDREALRVLRLMPTWKPGVQNGKPCRTRVVVPIWFRL